jgi:hypothetical protein
MSHSTTARSGTRSLTTDTRRKLRRGNIEHEGPSTLLGPSLIFGCTYVCGAVPYDPAGMEPADLVSALQLVGAAG